MAKRLYREPVANGEVPAMEYTESPTEGYTLCGTDVKCIGMYWDSAEGMTVDDVVSELKLAYSGVWGGYEDEEKEYLAMYCVAAKADRDTLGVESEVYMTNGYANHEYAMHEFIRKDMRSKNINEVDYIGIRELTLRLQFRRTWNHGHLLKIEFFESYEESTNIGTNKLLEIETEYTVNSSGDLVHREKTRKWFLSDNIIVGVETLSPKTVLVEDSIKEGNRRRVNIVDQLKKNIPGLIMATQSVDVDTARAMGGALFVAYKTGFELFIELKLFNLADDILIETSANFSWIEDQVPNAPDGYLVRNYLHDQITY